MITRKLEGWKFPKLEELEKYQANIGLNLGMLNEIEVRELVCGVSSEEEISEVREWIKEIHKIDQDLFGSQVISLDVEDVKVTYYDTLRMAGKLSIMPENYLFYILSKSIYKIYERSTSMCLS